MSVRDSAAEGLRDTTGSAESRAGDAGEGAGDVSDPASTGATDDAGAAALIAAPRRRRGGGRALPGAGPGAPATRAATGYYLFGVVRARGWRAGAVRGIADVELPLSVRYRDMEALARAAPFHMPELDRPGLIAHQRAVEVVMRRCTILPAPPGVVFRGRRSLLRFLEDQYLALDEGLAFVEGHWELRLHIVAANAADPGPELDRLAVHAYAELRRFARAAVPFRHERRRLLSAAFLVERSGWIDFVERAEDLGTAHPELAVDVTGPWPAYDFVRMSI